MCFENSWRGKVPVDENKEIMLGWKLFENICFDIGNINVQIASL